MGTTIVACMFFDNKVSVAHVGDSRAYRLRGGSLEQITLDHSLLQELVDRGFYSAEEA
jgi:protein phosphatase